MRDDAWTKCIVEDIAAPTKNALVGGPFGSNLVSNDYVPEGVPVIRGQNMGMGRWVAGDFVYVSEVKATSLNANIARPGDLVFTQRGTLGQVAIVPEKPFKHYLLSQSQMKLTVNKDKADTLFLYYLFSSPEQQEYIQRNAIQTGVPHTNLGILRNTRLALPPLAEQRAIAHILSTLDDKIELNHKMNETLEAIAQTLFKSWFVDFDPVRARAQGQEPEGLDAATAALFPDRFEDSELGEIPKGWRVQRINEAACLIIDYRGKTPQKLGGKWSQNGIPAISAKNIKKGRFVNKEAMNYVDDNLYGRWMKDELKAGDILMTSEAPLGELFYLARNIKLCLSQRVFALRANPEECLPTYLYFWLGSDIAQEKLQGRATGTTVTGIRQSELRKVEILLPPLKVQGTANRFFHNCLLKISANEAESETIAAIRDALLPKLISGEIRVKR